MKRSILSFVLLVIFAVQTIECFAQSGSDEKSPAQTTPLYQGFIDPPHDFLSDALPSGSGTAKCKVRFIQ